MKTLYLDIFSGISGDMFIGALLDLGVDGSQLELQLQKLKLEGYHLHIQPGQKAGISGVKFDVHLHEHAHEHTHANGSAHAHPHSHSHHEPHHDHDYHDHDHTHAHSESHHHEHEHGRNFSEITQLIQASSLSAWVK